MKKLNRAKIELQKKNLQTIGWPDYELMDSGHRKKLERFGNHKIIRFEKEAVWKPSLPTNAWRAADSKLTILKGERIGSWQFFTDKSRSWSIKIDKFNFLLNISESRHIGIFPEQIENWRWIEKKTSFFGKNPKILNLFGYTGAATLYATRGGALVTHVDASRKSIEMGKKSFLASNLEGKPVRWLVDDAIKFIEKEIRRGNKYDGIIMDPPRFGRGPNGEVWKFNRSILNLYSLCKKILSDNPIFFVTTAYDIDQSIKELAVWMRNILKDYGGTIEYGDLIQQERSSGRKIKQAVYTRWSPNKQRI